MTVDNDVEQKDPAQTMADLEKKLTASVGNVAEQALQAKVQAKLMNDPEIGAILRARAQGQKLKILTADEFTQMQQTQSSQAQNDQSGELEGLDGSPEKIVSVLEKRLQKSFQETIKASLAPLTEKVTHVEQNLQLQQAEKVQTSVSEVRKKFKDFDEYTQQMIDLNQQVGGTLPPQELYMIAKTRAGKPVQTERQLDTERPSSDTVRPPRKPINARPGVAGQRDILGEVLKNLDTSELDNMIPRQ